MSPRSTAFLIGAILLTSAGLRGVWLTSDPPTVNPVGVVWHDEGPWTHNARNKALFGVWRTDNWNPMYLAPVFTALEYASFSTLGVGTWQARIVPVVSGIAAVVFLMAGLAAAANRRAAMLGGLLLAVNYGFVMWNRAALMESTMTAFIVASWAAYAMAARRPWWGAVAGVAAVLAFFTKASAAFFVAALGLEALIAIGGSGVPGFRGSGVRRRGSGGPVFALAGLISGAAIAVALFVLPHWEEFRFYNWQMSVARKPEYTLRALVDRATWLPLVQDFFLWMWPVLAAATIAVVGIVARAHTARPAERLLALWVLIGLAELVVHDSGNWRRYVMFIPAFIALGVMWLTRERQDAAREPPGYARWLAVPVVAALGYLVAGTAIRVFFADEIRAGSFATTVRLSAIAASAAAIAALVWWSRISRWIATARVPVTAAVILVGLTAVFDLARYATWASARQALNYRASVEVGALLPAGTLVHGKLANGLALENRIRPVFIGREFGNYADRLQRDDVRYILTYVSPSVGYESQAESGMIQELLSRYPGHRAVATFAINDTGGPDRAALIDKFPGP